MSTQCPAACVVHCVTAATVVPPYHCCRLQTPEGKAPDVWQRLPAQGLTLALRHHHEDTFHEPGTMNSLAEAVSEHSLHVEATCMQLRQELTELRAHSQQWGNERRELPQEVAELRAAVATMQAQVQSLLEQKQF